MTSFALDSGLDASGLAAMFARNGRLQIRNFLTRDSAGALLAELEASQAWRLAANRGDQVVDFGPEALARFGPEEWAKLQKAIILGGRHGFQFCYETIRLPRAGEERRDAPPLLGAFADFLSSLETLAFLRTLTGMDDIAFADAHASRYRPGHFLSAHDDASEGMGRRAAYVLNLTREWRPDWGGLLLFYDQEGNIVRGYTPGFNVLNIFAVPRNHSVTWVTPLAGQPRYAVTGWLRTGERS